MGEKLLTFIFAGILGIICYHYAAAAVLHQMMVHSEDPFTWWYVPLIVIPAALLLLLAGLLGFGRKGSTLWGNVMVLFFTAAIVFFTVGAPYNCWNQFCF